MPNIMTVIFSPLGRLHGSSFATARDWSCTASAGSSPASSPRAPESLQPWQTLFPIGTVCLGLRGTEVGEGLQRRKTL